MSNQQKAPVRMELLVAQCLINPSALLSVDEPAKRLEWRAKPPQIAPPGGVGMFLTLFQVALTVTLVVVSLALILALALVVLVAWWR